MDEISLYELLTKLYLLRIMLQMLSISIFETDKLI